jgi:hypothetical protein
MCKVPELAIEQAWLSIPAKAVFPGCEAGASIHIPNATTR